MAIADRLASALDRRDQQPNIALGLQLADAPDPAAVAELVAVAVGDDHALAGDATKALEELALADPGQVAPHADALVSLLRGHHNRLVWGAMTVLRAIALTHPDAVRPHVSALIEAVDSGSVITQDHGVGALAATGNPAALDYALGHLRICGPTHVALRGERIAPHASGRVGELEAILESRLPELTNSAVKRVVKLIASLNS